MLIIVSLAMMVHDAAANDATIVGKTPIHRAETTTAERVETGTTGAGGSTLVFLGLLLAGAIVVRRVVQQRVQKRHGAPSETAITLLNRQQIDNELTVRLLQIGPRILVVGSSPQGLATLADISDPVEVVRLSGGVPAADPEQERSLFGGHSAISRSTDARSPEPMAAASRHRMSPSTAAAETGG